MAIRLLLIQLAISCYWLAFVLGGLDPITLPLVAAFVLLPLVGVLSTARISPINVIPLLVLFTVGYLAWLYGWDPSGPAFACITGFVFLIAWNGCTQATDRIRMHTVWLGITLYCPLLIMAGADVLGISSMWPPVLGIAIQSGALIFALRSEWPVHAAITDETILRMNGLAMLMVPVIFITDQHAVYGIHEHILGIGGAISAIVMTRQHLRFRKRLLAANRELANYIYRDQLTGLLTWAGLQTHLMAHPMTNLTMVCVDIDQFGQINAEAGFEVGDQLLRHIGRTVSEVLPDGIHARIGGDFFVAIVDEPSADPEAYETAYATIVHAFDPDLQVTVTAGVASSTTVAGLEDCLGQCDMHIAKRRAERRTLTGVGTT